MSGHSSAHSSCRPAETRSGVGREERRIMSDLPSSTRHKIAIKCLLKEPSVLVLERVAGCKADLELDLLWRCSTTCFGASLGG
jgi:hypothetical protein